MTTNHVDHERSAEVVPLRAVPAEVDGPSSGPAAYQDVTTPGERRPILPPWLASVDGAKHHARRAGGYAWHAARFHGLRSPVYLVTTLAFAVVGALRLALAWLHWWLMPVPAAVHADAIADGHRAWHRAYAVHLQATKVRAIISLAVVVAGFATWVLAAPYVPVWAAVAAAAVAAVVLARFGRPEGARITQPARVPAAYEALTQDVITRALGSLGIAGINAWLREGNPIAFAAPVRQDGPGWRAELDLPFGVTATAIIDRREALASGLRRPLGAVWPEPVTHEHAGRLELWVGQQDVSKRKPATWPLLKAGTADVFASVPFGTDVRGRTVKAPLIYHNWLIGSMPRNGKTSAVRTLACGIALDPLPGIWAHELKGTGDLDALEPLCERFTSGIDDESIGYAAESLRLLRAEVERRSPLLRALPPEICPDKRVTRVIAQRYPKLRPKACIIDECQNLFAHPKYGKGAGADAEFIIKIGPASGIFLILATQRPDKESLPTGISGNVSLRFCLYVAGQIENDMILGTSAYKNGVRATLFRPEVDAGLGYLKGATPAPKVVRTFYLDVPAARSVVARARAARERAGTLPVPGNAAQAPRDVLADAAAVFTGEAGLHWAALAQRLAQRWPDRYAGMAADAVSAELRAAGVPTVTVSMGGVKAKGCRKQAIEAAAGADGSPRSQS